MSVNKRIAFLYFSFTSETFSSSLQLCFMLFGTDFEVLTVVMFHNAIWVRTPYSLVNGYECFRGAFWAYLLWLSKDGGHYILTETLIPTRQITWPHNLENCNFET